MTFLSRDPVADTGIFHREGSSLVSTATTTSGSIVSSYFVWGKSSNINFTCLNNNVIFAFCFWLEFSSKNGPSLYLVQIYPCINFHSNIVLFIVGQPRCEARRLNGAVSRLISVRRGGLLNAPKPGTQHACQDACIRVTKHCNKVIP